MSAVLAVPAEEGLSPHVEGAAPVAKPLAELTATDRLTLSRERLRSAMLARSTSTGAASNRIAGAASSAWLASLKSIPGAGILIEALDSWWTQHPLRLASMVAADAVKAGIQPLAQRHPLSLMLAALLLGGALARSRPWRWLLKPALFAGLMPQLLSKAIAQLPAPSWVAALTALTQAQRIPRETPARAPVQTPVQAPTR